MNVNYRTIYSEDFRSLNKDPHTFYQVFTRRSGGLYDQNNNLSYSWAELISQNIIEEYTDSGRIGVKLGSAEDAASKLNGKLVLSREINFIQNKAFTKCNNLTDLIIPSNISNISQEAFSNCTNLTCVLIEEGVTSVGALAFEYCSNLKTVIFPKSLTSIYPGAFRFSGLEQVVIPSRLQLLGSMAFAYCSDIQYVEMYSGADTTQGSEFSGCTKLSRFNSDTEGKANLDAGTASIDISAGTFDTVTFGADITEIKAACRGCSTLETVIILGQVTSIASYAFSGCKKLKNISLPNGLLTINKEAFYDCTGISDLVVPDSVTTIGSNAFKFVSHVTYHGTATGSPWGAYNIN